MNDKIKVSCLGCGATNNFPRTALGKTVVCGQCKTALPPPGQVLEPLENQIAVLVQKAVLPILLDFYSTTCMACRMMNPIIEALAERRAGEIMVVRINFDNLRGAADAFRIQALPTFIVMRQGQERGRTVGAMSETDFSLWVASRS